MRLFRRSSVLILFAALGSPQLSQGADVREWWDVMYLGKTKVGYTHTVMDELDVAGRAVVRVHAETVMTIKRFNDAVSMKLDMDSFELSDGRLYAFDAVMRQAGQDQTSTGRRGEGCTFKLTLGTLNQKQVQSVPWSEDVLGPEAMDRLMRAKAPESRKLKTFVPALNQVVEVEFKELGRQKTTLQDGATAEYRAVKALQRTLGADGKPGQSLPETTFWIDDKGEAVRSEMQVLVGTVVTSYRGTKAAALDESGSDKSGPDIGFSTLVAADKPIPNPRQTRAVDYRLDTGGPEAAESLSDGGYQKVVKRQGDTVWLRVERRTPKPGTKPGPAAAEFLEPNGFIQSDDAQIVETAKKATAGVADPWAKCQKLERWVRENMSKSDFTVGFATAADTMRSLRGDCTEHGVLLAALCRAEGIPSRVAMGLVYVDSLKSFGYHMWTEVNFGGEWYALDGTLGDGAVAGDHIKVGDGSLKGASALSTLLPVFKVMGKLKIVVEKVE